MHQLILASESPRRKQLLKEAGFQFETLSVKVSEIPGKNLTVDEKILANAKEKSDAAWTLLTSRKNQPFVLLTADTEVVLNDELLGKPTDVADAERILNLLSGKRHQVKTGLWLRESLNGKVVSQVETTNIYFRRLSPEEIKSYACSGEGLDKAGAYAIQGQAAHFIEKFEGSYDNVVGLPIQTLKKILNDNGWQIAIENCI